MFKSVGHKRAETQSIVERAVMLLIELVRRCEGLDSADPELARYALDLHELGPKNIIVVPDDPTNIVRRPFSPPPPPFFLCCSAAILLTPLPPSISLYRADHFRSAIHG